MSELPQSAAGAHPSVRATFVNASKSLADDQVADVCLVGGRPIRCRLNCVELDAAGARARDPGHYSRTWRRRCQRTSRRTTDLPCERRNACVPRNELTTGVARR